MLRVLLSGALFLLTILARAEMKPLENDDLREVTGQAIFSVDQQQRDGLDFLRLDVGAEIKTQINIDELKIGEYHRYENGAPCPDCTGNEAGLEAQPADIWVRNMSLGSIAEYSGIHSDGKYYEEGDIIPFTLIDPFIEMATEDGELVGFRAGVKQAQGTFGGDLLSLTGNFPIRIKDRASALTRAPNRPWWIGLAGALLPGTPVESQANLVTAPQVVNGEVDYTTGGQLDNVRATHFGLPDGSDFNIGPIPFIGNITFNTTDCNLFGIPVCFPTTQFKSFEVGEKQSDGTFTPAGGWFLSMQNQALNWRDPLDDTLVRAEQGAFFSLPVGGVELTLDQAFQGTDAPKIEYINRDPLF